MAISMSPVVRRLRSAFTNQEAVAMPAATHCLVAVLMCPVRLTRDEAKDEGRVDMMGAWCPCCECV